MILIIGYGHGISGENTVDEAIGVLVAQRLLLEPHEPDMRVLACEFLSPELAEILSRAELAIFLGGETCTTCEMRCTVLEPIEFISHYAGEELCPRHLLAIARTQWGHAPRAYEIAASPWVGDSSARLLPEIISLVHCLIRSQRHHAVAVPLRAIRPEAALISSLMVG